MDKENKRLPRAPDNILREEMRLPPKLTREEEVASWNLEERAAKRVKKAMHREVMKGRQKTLLSFFVDANGKASRNHNKKKKAWNSYLKQKTKKFQEKMALKTNKDGWDGPTHHLTSSGAAKPSSTCNI